MCISNNNGKKKKELWQKNDYSMILDTCLIVWYLAHLIIANETLMLNYRKMHFIVGVQGQ